MSRNALAVKPITGKTERAIKMGRRKHKPIIGEAFVPVLKYMITSQAFINLTNPARVAYLLLKAQCNKFGQNEVKFPYSHAEKYMDRHTFQKAIKQLIDNGFIEKTSYGGLYRRTNVYKFKEDWRKVKEEEMAYSKRGVKIHTTETAKIGQNKCEKPHRDIFRVVSTV